MGNLTSIDFSNFSTKSVNSMSYMFSEDISLKELDSNKFITSSATDMTRLFYSCGNLTSINLRTFDMKNVILMHGICRM